jgi:hypothetical protein
VIFLGYLSNSLRNCRIHLGYLGHTYAALCARRAHTCGFVLVRLLYRRREVLAIMSSGCKVLSIIVAFVFNVFLVRHRIDVVSYCVGQPAIARQSDHIHNRAKIDFYSLFATIHVARYRCRGVVPFCTVPLW